MGFDPMELERARLQSERDVHLGVLSTARYKVLDNEARLGFLTPQVADVTATGNNTWLYAIAVGVIVSLFAFGDRFTADPDGAARAAYHTDSHERSPYHAAKIQGH